MDEWKPLHVGTKSAEDCIRHFIRLPIEDRFIDDMEAGVGAGGRAGRVAAAAAAAAVGPPNGMADFGISHPAPSADALPATLHGHST